MLLPIPSITVATVPKLSSRQQTSYQPSHHNLSHRDILVYTANRSTSNRLKLDLVVACMLSLYNSVTGGNGLCRSVRDNYSAEHATLYRWIHETSRNYREFHHEYN
jgi:hypothetical protein